MRHIPIAGCLEVFSEQSLSWCSADNAACTSQIIFSNVEACHRSDKADAERKAHKVKRVAAVRDDIQVSGPVIPDHVLQSTLLSKIESDRIGYGTTTFNPISLNVQDGAVMPNGRAYGPIDKQSVIIDASYMVGVKDVVDHIQVDPVSMMDDRIRAATARAVTAILRSTNMRSLPSSLFASHSRTVM